VVSLTERVVDQCTRGRSRARLAVTRADFPYADRVFRHRFGEGEASFMRRLARSGLLGS
jgi:hypothetical protein